MSTNSKLTDTEKLVLESEEKFKSLFNGINQPVFVHQLNPEGFNNFIEVNDVAWQRYGYSREEFLNLSPKDISSLEDTQKTGYVEGRRKLKEEGQAIFEATHITRDGNKFPVEISSNIFNWLGQKAILSIAVDITERKRAEEALSQAYNIINRSPAVVFLWKNETNWPVEFVSENVDNLLGYTVSDFIEEKISYSEIIHQDDLIRVAKEVTDASKESGLKAFTHKPYRIVTKKGDVKWLSDNTQIRRDPNGVITHYEGIVHDITERKKVEEDLLYSEAKYRQLIENSSDAIYLLYKNRFEIINARFTELFGITLEHAHAPEFNFMNLVSPESRSLVQDRLRAQAEGRELESKYEFKALDAQGQTILVETSVSQIKYKNGVAIQGTLRDITHKRQFEQQLHHSQKMEAIGTLAGGIAHDFNNLLTVINGYSQLALQKVDRENHLFNTLESILHAGKKAVKLTSQLLAFSRKQIYQTDVVNINTVIDEMDTLLRRIIGEDINIDTVLGGNLSRIKADKSQLEQIFVNLVVNARDAVYASNKFDHKPKITIETGETLLDETYVSKHPGSSKGSYVFISVSDNGVGMDEATKQKIFEPFFSTKEKYKGTGLGLATVYGIVKQNRGSIYVYSEPNQGTTFKIYWPVTSEEMIHEPGITLTPGDLSGSESILFVEDDEEVSRFAFDSLTSLGYHVSRAANGHLAFELFITREGKFDIIVTDLVMPELNGKEFVKKVKKIKPDIRVIYVSGYTDNHIVHDGMLETGVNFIQKPYSIETLSGKIRQVLDRHQITNSDTKIIKEEK